MSKSDPSASVWRNVRLELAPTAEFPRGSASRAYLLSLPLRRDGTVDRDAVSANPRMARFRRFWPSEPERTGLMTQQDGQWMLCFEAWRNGAPATLHLAMDRLRPGDDVSIEKREGSHWRFRVIALDQETGPSGSG